jgi:hypothetical protein
MSMCIDISMLEQRHKANFAVIPKEIVKKWELDPFIYIYSYQIM